MREHQVHTQIFQGESRNTVPYLRSFPLPPLLTFICLFCLECELTWVRGELVTVPVKQPLSNYCNGTNINTGSGIRDLTVKTTACRRGFDRQQSPQAALMGLKVKSLSQVNACFFLLLFSLWEYFSVCLSSAFSGVQGATSTAPETWAAAVSSA